MSQQPKASPATIALAESRRLESLQHCVVELNAKRSDSSERRVCQLVRVWPVDPKTRSVIPNRSFQTYVSGVSESFLTYLISRPIDEPYAVVELLGGPNKVLGRFFVVSVGAQPAIRGMYSIRTQIKAPVPSEPSGVVFHKAHFQQAGT